MDFSLLFFIAAGALCIAAAVGVVVSRHPVHSALFLLINFITLAVLYITLDAQFLAAAQVIVYAGGIVILILFVIMLIGSEPVDVNVTRLRSWAPVVGLTLGLVLVATLALSLLPAFTGVQPNAGPVQAGIPEAVGITLFTRHVLAVELAAVLLLVALLGALLVARPPKSHS